MIVAIILFVLFTILFLGVPIAFGLGSLGLGLMLLGDISPLMIPQTFYSVADNFILLAVPMFLMMSNICLLYTSPSPRDRTRSRMPSSA